ncbi:hypothetical protein K443DRAFT_682731 [Laccaria amethystina LaAM-08-1]|uniref:Uncharacterized protein n=1 Tax=Laccaria amethystina LaAM-08-1 TaxID=1095629 RepID=A0A0C9XDS1_9AGAR|nr:hypothetical protein K443DRAFT_682731 [Laccaria amethystina LaAM-08-1]
MYEADLCNALLCDPLYYLVLCAAPARSSRVLISLPVLLAFSDPHALGSGFARIVKFALLTPRETLSLRLTEVIINDHSLGHCPMRSVVRSEPSDGHGQ